MLSQKCLNDTVIYNVKEKQQINFQNTEGPELTKLQTSKKL